MKICFVTENLSMGGASKLTAEVLNYLVSSGYHVSLLTLKSSNNDPKILTKLNKKINHRELYFDRLSILSKIKLLRKLLSEYEVIHSSLELANFYCSFIAFFMKDKFFITTIHGQDGVFIEDEILNAKQKKIWSRKYIWSIKYLQNLQFKSYKLFIAESHDTKKFLIEKRNIDKNKIKVIHHGINICEWANEKFNETVIRKKYNFSNDDFIMGYVGRLSYGKGLENLINSFRELIVEFPDLKLFLIGDGELTEYLESKISEFGLEGKCIITGMVYDLPQYYNALNLFVLPSSSEGIPLTLLEAMYFKKVTLCTSVGGIPEVVTDGVNGFLFEKNNNVKMNEKLRFIIQNFDDMKPIASNAQDTIISKFDLSKNLKYIRNEIENLFLSAKSV